MSLLLCPMCTRAISLHEAYAVQNDHGTVDLWHRLCVAAGARAGARSPTPQVRRFATAIAGALVGVALIGTAVARATSLHEAPPPVPDALAEPAADDFAEPFVEHTEVVAREATPARMFHVDTAIEARWPVPEQNGTPLDEIYPTLRAWTHPVVGSAELMPAQTSRHFGQPRLGVDKPRPDCGEGHCGVDLDGPRGRPIVSVADGVVVRVERHELGLDGMSGRYVRIAHGDGTYTAYMHLDDVADELEVGDHVVAGQYLGTLGASATYGSVPQLHFSLELRLDPSADGDITDTRYIDPAPFLVRSDIAAAPIRKVPTKSPF
jgi:murein DD-endopeptidase MepM/ murein hydrolase activator NlpD